MDQKAFLITSKSISELFARSKRKPTDPSRPEPARSDSGQEKLPNSQADTDFGGSCLLSPDRLKRKYKKKKSGESVMTQHTILAAGLFCSQANLEEREEQTFYVVVFSSV